MKALPTGGKLSDPESPVSVRVVVDFRKFPISESLFRLLNLIDNFCNKSLLILGNFFSVVTVNCVLSYLVRLYVSLPTNTLR